MQTVPPAHSLTLPVLSHLSHLANVLNQVSMELSSSQKQLHILRGTITHLSYINKESDQQLNEFLIDSIASLRTKWAQEWEKTASELVDMRKRVNKLSEEMQDVGVQRQSVQQRVDHVQTIVGLIPANIS